MIATAQKYPEQLTEHQRYIFSSSARIEAIRRFAAQKDILNWGKILFPDKFPLPFCRELHDYFVDIREEEFTNTEAPRNHAKTTIKCFLIPLFMALNEPEKFKHYLNVQDTATKAISINSSIKNELESNDDLIAVYGQQQYLRYRWTEQQFVLKNGTIFTAIGAGQSLRGLNYRNIRPDYIIVDDLYDESDLHNRESTLKKNEWFWGTLYLARAKTKNSCLHVQGTPMNEHCLTEELKKKISWKSKSFKAIKNYELPNAEPIWPELNTLQKLDAERRDIGSTIFFRELQCELQDDKDSKIKRNFVKLYDKNNLKFDKNFILQSILLGVDPSVGQKAENDFTGIAKVIKACYTDSSSGNLFFIENVWNEKLSLDGRVKLLEQIVRDCPTDRPINRVRIESISGFKDFTSEVIRRTNLPVEEIGTVKDKQTNLESKAHFFENGKVYINKDIPCDLLENLIHQLTNNYPKHDDIRDAILLCLDIPTGKSLICVG